MQLSQLEAKVVRMFNEIAKTAESGNWDSVEHNINKGLVQTMIEAITTTYKELEEIRKRGGTNSRGINKR
jgi:DNA-binding cell septation regulator SpoVG